MPSEHPFDSKLKQQFEQFQPDVEGDWNAFEKRMNAGNASGSRVDVPTLNRWAVATAVAAGSALMWVAKPAVDALVEEETLESSAAVPEKDQAPTISFDDAWEAYSAVKSVDESSAESSSDAIAEVALTNAEPVSPSSEATLSTEHVMDNEVAEEAPKGGLDVEESTVSVEEHALTIEEILETLPFEASVNRACEGVEVAFELSGVERQMNFLWNFGDGHFSSEPTPTHTFDEPGTYDVTLSVRPSGEGSINTRTIQNMITVLPKPEATFASIEQVIATKTATCVVGTYAGQPTIEAMYPSLKYDKDHSGWFDTIDDGLIDGSCECAVIPRIEYDTWCARPTSACHSCPKRAPAPPL